MRGERVKSDISNLYGTQISLSCLCFSTDNNYGPVTLVKLSCTKFLDLFEHYFPNYLVVQMIMLPGFPSKILYVFIFLLIRVICQLFAYSSEQMFNTT